MEKNTDTADKRPTIDQNVIDLKSLRDRSESSEIYDTDEIEAFLRMEFISVGSNNADRIEGTQRLVESFSERRADKTNLVQRGKFCIDRKSLDIPKGTYSLKSAADYTGVLEKPHQLEEILCSPVSWLDIVLTIAAGVLIGIIVFGAFLF